MKLILTKSECKQNAATRVKTHKELKTWNKASMADSLFSVPFYNADRMIDEVLFSRLLFTEQLKLRSIKENKLFILENCSLYNTRKIARQH